MPQLLHWKSVFAALLLASLSIAGPAAANTTKPQPRILVMGDSLLAAHGMSGRAIGQRLQQVLGEPVKDHSVIGARMIYNLPITGAMGLSIPKQFRDKGWDWVVLNGGGNDLWLGCGCNNCDYKLKKLISPDGKRGKIPGLVSKIRQSGAKVVYLGYMRSPGFHSPVEPCKTVGAELEARIQRLADLDRGIIYHSLADMVPEGDLSFHAVDRIHPSLKASLVIAKRLARVIRSAR